nr:transposase [uncultured archaeon GZfos9E5]
MAKYIKYSLILYIYYFPYVYLCVLSSYSVLNRSAVEKRAGQVFKKKFYPMFDFKQGDNVTIGSTGNILDCIVHAAITEDFIENGTEVLRLRKRGVPAPRTVRYHLEKLVIDDILSQFNGISEELYRIAKKQRWFVNKVDLSIDIHDWMYYGDIDDEMVLGTQPKNGTSYAYKFATINVVERGIRFTLKALPIGDYSEICGVVEELLKYAMKKVKIRSVYLDRGFYAVPIVRMLKRLSVHFIIQAQKSIGIKKVIEENKDKEVIVVDYKMKRKRKAPSGKEDVRLFIVPHRLKKDKRVCFVTNLDVNEENAKDYAGNYRKRWGIETSYRVKKDAFRPKTTSKNYAIRLFFFLFSVSFYNLWVLASIVLGLVLNGRLPEKPLITAKMFGNLLITAYDSGG